jgi:hypothetical protein
LAEYFFRIKGAGVTAKKQGGAKMSEKSDARKINNREVKRRLASQRIIDSMPMMIDKIKAERERESLDLRKDLIERDKNQNAMLPP